MNLPPRQRAMMILLIILATGCSSSDDRLIRHVAESNRQQSQQNSEMAKVLQRASVSLSAISRDGEHFDYWPPGCPVAKILRGEERSATILSWTSIRAWSRLGSED